jgi:homoserine dehydrogenase
MLRLALIGFGNVGQGLVNLLISRAGLLKQQYGFDASVIAVATLRRGSLYHADGLDLDALLKASQLGAFRHYPHTAGLTRDWSPQDIITRSNADVVIELTYTDVTTGQPATDHVRAAFESGKHVVTANKGPVALHFHELNALAARKGLFFGYEATVMGGTPNMRLARLGLAGCVISGFSGIVNSTTNYILTEMERGHDYEIVLAQAQALGFAEADPTGDVEGYDALAKLVIVVNTIMGVPLRLDAVERQGITHLTAADVTDALRDGYRWKLVARAQRHGDGVTASVCPERLPLSDPLASVMGVTNAITYETDIIGPTTIVGAGAGGIPTGFAVLGDLLELHRGTR